MEEQYLKKLVATLEKNNFWTATGAVVGLVALVISLIALLK